MATVWGTKTDARTLRLYDKHAPNIEDFRIGERLRISVDRDRNGKFSALYHVMLSKLANAINRGPAQTDIDQLKDWVKLRKGWFDLEDVKHDGKTVQAIRFRSTAFAKMPEGEFHKFAVDTCELIRDDLAPWIGNSPEWWEIAIILDKIQGEAA